MRSALFLMMLVWVNSATGDELSPHGICKVISSEAATIMSERQSGARMSDMVERAHQSDRAVKDKVKMIIRAFDMPKEKTDERKREAVQDFENQIYLDCMKVWAS